MINNFIEIIKNEASELPYRPSSGPGGQKVNKTSNGVRLIFNFRDSVSLSDDTKARIEVLGGNRITEDGMLVISSHSFRSLERNREEARIKLSLLIEKAARPPKKRRATKATKASHEKRLKGKAIRSGVKATRARVNDVE